MSAPKRRLSWAEMDHDRELLLEEIIRRSNTERRGPIAEFLAKKEAEQERKTFLGYRTELLRFWSFLGENATVGDVQETAGHRFLGYLKKLGLSDNSIATSMRCLKAFTRWMHKKGWTERDRFEDVKRPQFVRPKFDTLSMEEKQAIFSDFNADSFLGARNLAILCVFIDTGIRLEELVHLKEERVYLGPGYIEVFSEKTDDWRIVPLSPETVAVCQNYLKWRTKFLNMPIRHEHTSHDPRLPKKSPRVLSTDTFFCSWKGTALTESGVGQMVRRLSRRLSQGGSAVHVHPHLFRHNFLTEKALDGENPSIVRRWAGHKSYEMTDYYFGLAEQKLAAIKPKQSTLAGISILPKRSGRGRRVAGPPELQSA